MRTLIQRRVSHRDADQESSPVQAIRGAKNPFDQTIAERTNRRLPEEQVHEVLEELIVVHVRLPVGCDSITVVRSK